MMPSARLAYMKKLVEGGAESIMPPSKEEVSEWKAVYLCYFNSETSIKHGRVMGKKYCIKNPRPDEITSALEKLGIRCIHETVSHLQCSYQLIVKTKNKGFAEPWPN